MLRMLQFSVHPSILITAHYIHNLLTTLDVPSHHCSLLHCSSPHTPELPPPMSHSTAHPHVPASHTCLLHIHLPPVYISPSNIWITSSASFPRHPLPLCLSGCYCHSILFHISTLSTASTAQVCNKFQLTHFFFLPSIYPDAFYQFPP